MALDLTSFNASFSVPFSQTSEFVNVEKFPKLFLSRKDSGLGSVSFKKESIEFEIKLPAFNDKNVTEAAKKRPATQVTNSVPAKVVKNQENTASQVLNPDGLVETTQRKLFSCEFCGLGSFDRGKVVRHISLEHLPKDMKCIICEYTTKWKNDMKWHCMNRHNWPEATAEAFIRAISLN